MSSKTVLSVLIVAALAGAGVGAYFLLRDDGHRVDQDSIEGGGAEGGRPGELKGPDGGSLAIGGGSSGTTRGVERDRRGTSTIVGVVRRGGAPTAATVELRYAMDSDPSQFFRGGRGGFFGRLLAPPLALERASAKTTAGADGKFEFSGIGRGAYEVLAIADDGARGATVAVIPVDGARVAADPFLSAGSEMLEGRVVYADGKPFTGMVAVDAARGEKDFLAMASTGRPVPLDADGSFRLTGLEAGAYKLSAIEPGVFRVLTRAVTVPREGVWVVTLGQLPVVIEGRVVSDAEGTGVAGAELLAGGQATEFEAVVRRTIADADGHFKIELPLGRDRAVFVNAAGYTPTMSQFAGPIPASVEIRLARGGRATGRVLTEDGKPVAGVRVTGSGVTRGSIFPPTTAESDRDGRYELVDLPPGEVTLIAEGAGWVTKGQSDTGANGFNPNVALVPPGSSVTVDIVVVKGGRLAGVVLDASGAPVAGAVVRAEAASSGSGMMRGPFGGLGPQVVSGADGSFRFDSLAEGTSYSLVASVAGFAEGRGGPSPASAAGDPPRVEIRLPAERYLSITVIDDASGAPVVGAGVRANVEGGAGTRGPWRQFTTGGDGVARLGPLPPGAIQVSVWHEDYVNKDGVRLAEGSDRETIRLARGGEVAVTVLGPDKKPSPGSRVRIEAQGGGTWRSPETADAEGRVRFRGLARGRYVLTATGIEEGVLAMSATTTVEVSGGSPQNTVLTLAKPEGTASTLVVRVLDSDGKPVPRAQVRFVSERRTHGVSASDGQAVIDLGLGTEGIAGGFVEVAGAASTSGAPLPLGPARVGPLAAGQVSVDVRLPPEKAVTGTLRGPDGKPVRGVLVVAVAPGLEREAYYDSGRVPQGRTDADGRFRVGRLSDDEFLLVVRAPPDFTAPEPVKVRGGQSGIDLALGVALSTTITVLDSTGAPVVGATVSSYTIRKDGGWEGEPISATTDARGAARLRGFDRAKTYSLSVTPSRGEFLSVQKSPWAPHDETIRVESALSITGVVKSPAGKPLADVSISRMTSDRGYSGGAQTDGDGRFTLEQLPAGEVTLRFAIADGGEYAPEPPPAPGAPGVAAGDRPGVVEVKTRAGTRDLAVTLDPGAELSFRLDDAKAGDNVMTMATVVRGSGRGARVSTIYIQGANVGRIRGLRSDDTVAVWVAPDAEGRSWLLRDARPSSETITIAPNAGGTLSGVVAGPPGSTNFHASAQAVELPITAPARLTPDNRFEVRGLPLGLTWKIRAQAQSGTEWLFGDSEPVSVPATVNVEVKKRGH